MTDKTDIAALTRPVRDRYDWSNAVWRDCDQCGKQHTGTVTAEDGSQICAHCADQIYWSAWQVLAERALDQLEAERQRADLATRQNEGINNNLRRRAVRAEAKLAALKGDQDPVCFVSDEVMSKLSRRESCYGFMLPELDTNDRFNTPLFTAQQKPVISKEKLCDWLEDNFDIDDSQRDAFAQCFARHCNCIVKKENE